MTSGLRSGIIYMVIFVWSTFCADSKSICLIPGIFSTNAVANIYDNQTKGDLIYTYHISLNGSLRFESHCDGINIRGNKIFLSVTNEQLEKDCENPAGECIVRCNPGNVRGSLFRKRTQIKQKGPTFRKSLFEITIPESQLLHSTVFEFEKEDIVRHDCFSPVDRVFSLTNEGKQAFQISYPGKIILAKKLDYEDNDHFFSLNVTLNNAGRYAYTTVNINVTDVDDMDPVFNNDNYKLSIKENVNYTNWMRTDPIIAAHDKDTGSGKQNIEFSLYNASNRNILEINKTTGEIKLKRIFDREKQSTYNFKIKVYQTNDIRRSATANLNVLVIDSNDNGPKFDKDVYFAKCDEHSSKGTLITTVHANDPDVGNNSLVVYSLETRQSMFQIGRTSGDITVSDQGAIDRENMTNPFILTVRATDYRLKHLTDTTIVKITILDQNDNSPIFAQKIYYFNVTNSVTIGQVQATDADIDDNGKLEYFIEYASDNNIKINKQSGVLSSQFPINDDQEVRVKVCDSAKMKSNRRCAYATVYLHISALQSRNLTMKASIMENMPTGTYISKVQVKGNSYEIIDSNVPFSIDSQSGVIATSSPLDYDDGHKFYEFMILVLNKANMIIAHIQMTVTVLDINDNKPEFSEQSYIFPIPDKIISGTIVGSVQAVDKDSGNNSLIHYHIQKGIDSQLFQINNKGEISIKAKTNEDKSLYQIYIVASDSGLPKQTSFVQVLITRVNIVGTLVAIGTPLTKDKVEKDKNMFERYAYGRACNFSKIGSILKIKTVIEEVKSVTNSNPGQFARSKMLISGQYLNGTHIPVAHLQRMVLNDIVEIQALFGDRRVQYVNLGNDGMSAAEIALIAIGGVIFVGTILLIVVLRRQWERALKYDRLRHNLMRKSSLYESQEIKVKLDDETSDYAGSLNTQEIEISQNSSKTASLDATAFANPVYESVHGPHMIISPSTIAATNEALESLQDLADRLNIEDRSSVETGLNDLDDRFADQTFVKGSEIPRIEASVDNVNYIIENDYSNFIFDSNFSDKVESSNFMDFEPRMSVGGESSRNGGDVFDEENGEIIEPSVDYNDKQVRFASVVLDTEDDIFKPLKEETISPAQFDYNSDLEDRESMGSSFPDLSTLIRQSESDETDRADEEINSPQDFLKADEIQHNPTDNGTFHFGFSSSEQNETTRF